MTTPPCTGRVDRVVLNVSITIAYPTLVVVVSVMAIMPDRFSRSINGNSAKSKPGRHGRIGRFKSRGWHS
ncbi:MAG: hypothetical protein LZF60_50003 [Nitrospira sp.]|nr:MAG: hypothetical protein LZF60_50003 [Nitrospira sp.]